MSSPHPTPPTWEPPTPEELQAMLPQYEITGLLGRGGMGAVYRGRQAKLDREVAIKLLPETFSKGDDELNYAKRFEQEARAMAKLDHPAIITVHDFGETAAGQLYFVMEFVDGMDISQYLRHHGGVLPQEHALAIVAHVLDALAYAHANGIVHRDIKPANVLLNREGRVKIADFGLAKRFGDHAGDDGPALTMSNVAVGTPVFVAPEALEGTAPVDQRADLYAVGVMLYQMLTGKLPRGHYSPASLLNPAIDRRLDPLLAKAMESDPGRRYASAEELRADLDAILSGPVPPVEAGEDTLAAAPAVPVDTILRGRKVSPPVKKGKAKAGIPAAWIAGLVGVVVLAGAVYLISKRGRSHEALPVAAKERLIEAKPGGAVAGAEAGTTDDPAKATKERPFVNSLGMKFVPVPGTDVLFCIHETRWKDYAVYAGEVKGVNELWQDRGIDNFTATERTDEHPVWRVNWHDAQNFCAWLGNKEGRTYRLPTDEEWSLAVGLSGKEVRSPGDTPESLNGRITDAFPWGATWPPPSDSGNFSDQSRKTKAPSARSTGYLDDLDDGYPTTAPVMSFNPNPFGIYDLAGNLHEWVEDWYSSKQENRIVRGGAFCVSVESELFSSTRRPRGADTRFTEHGFRIVIIRPEGIAASLPPATEAPETSDLTPLTLTPNAPKLVAEWALQNGHMIRIEQEDRRFFVTARADLPTGPFEILDVRFDETVESSQNSPLPWAALAACDSTRILNLRLKSLEPLNDLRHLGLLRNLASLELSVTGVPAHPITEALPDMPQLKSLVLLGDTNEACLKLFAEKYPQLELVALSGPVLPDEALASLSQMLKLNTLRLIGHGCIFPVTPAKTRILAELPKLSTLNLYHPPDETFTPELASELPRINKVVVNFLCSPSTLATLTALPALEDLTLSRIPTLRDEDFALLAAAKNLEQVTLLSCSLATPATLDHLAGIPSLTKLTLTDMPAFTEAHLAAFRERRRDVEVVEQ